MSTYIISENGVERPMTEKEIAEYEAYNAQRIKDDAEAEAAAVTALEARKAPLRRLGLTEDEINTVLGL